MIKSGIGLMLGCIMSIGSTINPIKISAFIENNITPVINQPTKEVKIDYNTKYPFLGIMSNCVEAEAKNQGRKGMRLVADVILNRVDSDRFPNTVEDVISQENQFSSYTDGGMLSHPASKESVNACIKELEATNRLDSEILFFTAGEYNIYCEPMYQYKDHYFGR